MKECTDWAGQDGTGRVLDLQVGVLVGWEREGRGHNECGIMCAQKGFDLVW